MSSILPGARQFETAVYGTIFAGRSAAVARLHTGDALILVPDPEEVHPPNVWVHAPGGDVLGHLAPDINKWLAPHMLDGARYRANVVTIGAADTESWRRLIIHVERV